MSKLIDNKIPVYNIPVGFIGGDDTLDKHPASDVPRLISVARYAVEKQLDHQIRLVKRLNEKFPNVELHMFGAGAEHAKLKSLIDENNLGDNVFLRGFVPDLQNEFQQSHINLLTSRMEGFSLALLEAASYGVPSVSYDIEYGPAEIIKNNERKKYVRRASTCPRGWGVRPTPWARPCLVAPLLALWWPSSAI